MSAGAGVGQLVLTYAPARERIAMYELFGDTVTEQLQRNGGVQ